MSIRIILIFMKFTLKITPIVSVILKENISDVVVACELNDKSYMMSHYNQSLKGTCYCRVRQPELDKYFYP